VIAISHFDCEWFSLEGIRVTLGPLGGHIGVTMGSLWGQFGVTMGSLWGRFGAAWGASLRSFINCPHFLGSFNSIVSAGAHTIYQSMTCQRNVMGPVEVDVALTFNINDYRRRQTEISLI
jgi:hypothetical protein